MFSKIRRINKDSLLIYFIFFFCFEPKLFVKYNIINYIFIVGAVVSFLLILIKTFGNTNSKKISKMTVMVIVYRLSFAVQTFTVENGDITMWGYLSIVLVSLCLTFDYYAKRRPYFLLSNLTDVLLYLVIVNLMIVFIYPKGIIDEIYFIGIRTRTTDVLFPLIAFSLICDYLKGITISVRTIIALTVSFATIVKLWIATAIVGGIIICAFLLFQNSKIINKFTNLYVIVLVGLVVNYLVVYVDIAKQFAWFIQGVLHKSITLSARTMIWEKAKVIINQSLLFGYGMTDNGNFVWHGYSANEMGYWQAHNMWLQMLHDGGLITTSLFVYLICMCGKKLKKYNNLFSVKVLLSVIMTFFIMMISEIYSYTPYFFLLIFACYYIEYFEKIKIGDIS